jgi:hypothetical protein
VIAAVVLIVAVIVIVVGVRKYRDTSAEPSAAAGRKSAHMNPLYEAPKPKADMAPAKGRSTLHLNPLYEAPTNIPTYNKELSV